MHCIEFRQLTFVYMQINKLYLSVSVRAIVVEFWPELHKHETDFCRSLSLCCFGADARNSVDICQGQRRRWSKVEGEGSFRIDSWRNNPESLTTLQFFMKLLGIDVGFMFTYNNADLNCALGYYKLNLRVSLPVHFDSLSLLLLLVNANINDYILYTYISLKAFTNLGL